MYKKFALLCFFRASVLSVMAQNNPSVFHLAYPSIGYDMDNGEFIYNQASVIPALMPKDCNGKSRVAKMLTDKDASLKNIEKD